MKYVLSLRVGGSMKTMENKYSGLTLWTLQLMSCYRSLSLSFITLRQELMGVAYRGSFDLSCHAKGSGKSFEYLDKENFEHLQRKEEKEGSVGTRCVPVSATQTQTEAKCEDERSEAHVTSKLQARKYVPHCIEPSVGVDRLFLALLVSAYHEEKVGDLFVCVCMTVFYSV